MKNHAIPVLLVTISLLSILMIGEGTTGFVALDDEGVKELCSSNDVCSSGEVCCPFYGQESGVCNTQSMCGEVLKLSQEQLTKKEAAIQKLNAQERDAYRDSLTDQTFFGAVILIFAFLALIIYLKNYHVNENHHPVEKKIRGKKRAIH